MSNQVQSKIDRLKQMLGEDFPEPLLEPEPEPEPEREREREPELAQVDEKDEFEKANPYDPNIKVIVDGSETDSDPDTVHRHIPKPSSSNKEKKKPRRRQATASTNGKTNGQQNRLSRIDLDFLLFNPHHEKLGLLAPQHQTFCPMTAISKYPYKFAPRDVSEDIAKKFFNEGKFWQRAWEVWYIWPPVDLSAKPIYLVPVHQVESLLDDIYFEFDRSEQYFLTLGDEAKDFGLVLEFPYHPALRPRYLGLSQSREAFTCMERHTPLESFRPKDEPLPENSPDSAEVADWRRILQDGLEISRGRNAASKAGKKEKQAQRKRAWVHELHRAERLLGFRPTRQKPEEPGPDASWTDLQTYHVVKSSHRKLSPIDPCKLPPCPFDTNPIFISVDVECNELQKSQVTEVGLAMLDTASLKNIAPGLNGTNWHSAIKARHFRTVEFTHIRNTHFMGPMGAAAEHFMHPENGSEMVSLADAPAAIASCFFPPFCDIARPWLREPSVSTDSGDSKSENGSIASSSENETSYADVIHENVAAAPPGSVCNGSKEGMNMPGLELMQQWTHLTHENLDGSSTNQSNDNCDEDNKGLTSRNIVLVGHDIQQDIRYLRSLGIDLESLGSTSTIDTANLCRAHLRELNPRSLSHLLLAYDLVGKYHHNAGNDAVHTLWAMVALVMSHCMERGSEEAKRRHEERKQKRVEDAVIAAGTHAIEEEQGWDSEPDF